MASRNAKIFKSDVDSLQPWLVVELWRHMCFNFQLGESLAEGDMFSTFGKAMDSDISKAFELWIR